MDLNEEELKLIERHRKAKTLGPTLTPEEKALVETKRAPRVWTLDDVDNYSNLSKAEQDSLRARINQALVDALMGK